MQQFTGEFQVETRGKGLYDINRRVTAWGRERGVPFQWPIYPAMSNLTKSGNAHQKAWGAPVARQARTSLFGAGEISGH